MSWDCYEYQYLKFLNVAVPISIIFLISYYLNGKQWYTDTCNTIHITIGCNKNTVSCTHRSLNPFLIFLLLPPSSLKITSITIKLNMIYHIMYYVHCTRITRQWADRKQNDDNRSNARPRRPRRGLRAPLIPINVHHRYSVQGRLTTINHPPDVHWVVPRFFFWIKNPILSFLYSSDEQTGIS